MNFNFRYAELHGGYTYLRYDDTNPEAEEQSYFDRYAVGDPQHAPVVGRACLLSLCLHARFVCVCMLGLKTHSRTLLVQHSGLCPVARVQAVQGHRHVRLF
jgi:hypothetical protein